MWVCVSVFLIDHTIAVPVGPMHRRLIFERHAKGLANVHSVFLCLQILIIALVFVVILGFAVVRRRMARQCWGWRHRGRPGVTEAWRLRFKKKSVKSCLEYEAAETTLSDSSRTQDWTYWCRIMRDIDVSVGEGFSQGHVTGSHIILIGNRNKKTLTSLSNTW